MQSVGNNQSVNTNVAAGQNNQQESRLDLSDLSNFDTSEADSILGGGDGTSNVEVVPQQLEVEQPVEQQQQQQQAQQFTPEQINFLRQQIAAGQQDQQQPAQTQEADSGLSYSDGYVSANAKFKEQTGMEFGQAIDEYMRAVVGMPLKETIEVVQGMSSYINQRQAVDAIEQSTNQLKTDWGVNYDSYMAIARAEYNKLPQKTAQEYKFKESLNNSQGAKLLLAQALQNQGVTGTAVARTAVQYNPMNVTSPASTVTNGNQPKLRMSQILNMTDAQYASPEVDRALALGAGVGYIDDVGLSAGMSPTNQPTQPQQMTLY